MVVPGPSPFHAPQGGDEEGGSWTLLTKARRKASGLRVDGVNSLYDR